MLPFVSSLALLTNSISFRQSTSDPIPVTNATAIKIAVPSIQAKQIIINFIYSKDGEDSRAGVDRPITETVLIAQV